MIGHHSNSETVDHALVSVPEAYASVISASNSPDPVVEEGRKSVMKQLNRVQAKAEVILSNATQIREQLTKAYNIALAELDEQISKKVNKYHQRCCYFNFFASFYLFASCEFFVEMPFCLVDCFRPLQDRQNFCVI